MEIAGDEITFDLQIKLGKKDKNKDVPHLTHGIANDIKEKLCYVAKDFETEMKQFDLDKDSKEYTLPDGKSVITVGNEQFLCTEMLFDPSLNDNTSDKPGIHKIIDENIKQCSQDMQSIMYSNIILAGGTTKLENIGQRLTNELTKLVDKKTKVVVESPANREYLTWIGGSILSSLMQDKTQLWMTKDEYDQSGCGLVHRKCF